jgi:hypothetical protein
LGEPGLIEQVAVGVQPNVHPAAEALLDGDEEVEQAVERQQGLAAAERDPLEAKRLQVGDVGGRILEDQALGRRRGGPPGLEVQGAKEAVGRADAIVDEEARPRTPAASFAAGREAAGMNLAVAKGPPGAVAEKRGEQGVVTGGRLQGAIGADALAMQPAEVVDQAVERFEVVDGEFPDSEVNAGDSHYTMTTKKLPQRR